MSMLAFEADRYEPSRKELRKPRLINNPDTRFEGGNKSILDVKEIITLPISIKVTPDVLEDKWS
jgi:hypothetical protein